MPKAARLSDPASHMMTPMSPGAASANVNIGGMKAWRALPVGLGAGIESALNSMKQLVDSPTLDPVSTPATLTQVFAGLMQDAAKAAGKGSPSAPGTTAGEFGKLMATNIKETATYASAAAVPGGQPAALAAYTLAMKKAAADFASAAIKAIAGMTDTHVCPQPSGPIPHGPGVVTRGSKSVFINGLPACRQGDKLFEAAGGSDPIVKGCPSVNIGDDGGGPGSGDSTPDEAASAEALALAEQIAWAQTSPAAPVAAKTLLSSQDRAEWRPTQAAPEEESAKKTQLEHRVAFRVVIDQTGEPVPGVALQITLPDGQKLSRTTDDAGQIEIADLTAPGQCRVACSMEGARLGTTYDFVGNGELRSTPVDLHDAGATAAREPRGGIIAEIEAHRVQTGETLESLARAAGLTWQELALFNWSTSNPDEINRHLRADVGCTQTTRDGRNYIFDSNDEPGIVYVPRPWMQSGLATDRVHTLRVQTLAYGPHVRRLRLFDAEGKAIPGALYAVEVNDREVSRGQADENGDIMLTNIHASVCTVRWSHPGQPAGVEMIEDGDSPDDAPAMCVPDSEFDYARDIHIDLDTAGGSGADDGQDAVRKRLSNMGYCAGQTLAEQVSAFQRDARQAVTGVLEDALAAVRDHHDERCRPPG